MVTVGDCNLARSKHPEKFASRLLINGMTTFPIGPATKSHLSPSITIIINFVTTGLYNACFFTLKTIQITVSKYFKLKHQCINECVNNYLTII